ncbi:putative tubulin-tyrsoine ligase-like protein [Trypanosoma rangeli]|uniref:Putative tubulin-tyrsoine ligase-like protein n=1 Tax=Trypanosoma rangeli TaxID=5698 RepID=A0A3R7LAU2_TRYRA|nr:putative tubulin-tyrsoine ligase-like protein [Trypanosoma rangeli]RNF10617.1 putative tubulin-tyrsoine ligase-like protein [Trypanosoma rangeli]|eukprot:RNF10617.1 putative tubulin-tyrsoine ligase-like protein [Trypanosoma rangeli]
MPLHGDTTVTDTSATLSVVAAAGSRVMSRTEVPALVVLRRRRRGNSQIQPQQEAPAECGESGTGKPHIIVVTQHGPIHTARVGTHRHSLQPTRIVSSSLSARVTGASTSEGNYESGAHAGSNGAAFLSFCSSNRHRRKNSLVRHIEGAFVEVQDGDKSSARRSSRRRIGGNVYGNDKINKFAKEDENAEHKPGPSIYTSAHPAVGLLSPTTTLRLADLECAIAKHGQVSLRVKANGTKCSRMNRKIVNLHLCKYSLLRIIAEEQGFRTQETEDELEKNQFNLVWSDTVLPLTRLVRLANWQRTNHFPSMYLLCRKGHLGITLGKMRRALPSHFLFYPRTWSLRSERHQFMGFVMALRSKKVSKFFILKPNSGCQGRGIVISRDPLSAVEDVDNYVVQEYVTRPLLLEGHKFDLRVYVLLTSIRAPSIFMFNDGLVRICAELYEKPNDNNVRNACKHLTNYAVNKHSPEYVFNNNAEDGHLGSKRNFKFLNEWLEASGKCPVEFWAAVAHLICKTILVAQPQITSVYNSCFSRPNDGYNCFEVLGFDILIDHKMKPWLMEVNHTPSLATDTPLDYDIKHALIKEVWEIIDIKASDKRQVEKKERNRFVQRVMCQPLAAQNVTGTKSERGTDITASTSTPTTNSLPQQQLLKTPLSLTGGTQEQVMEEANLIEERRAREDAKLCNFQRIYPTTDVQHQLVYDAILAQARTQFGSPRPSWVSSPAPTTPQTTEERYRRFDVLSVGVPNPPRAAFGTSLRDRSVLSTPCEPVADASINSLSNISTYSMGQQMQRLCEDMKLSQSRGKPTPRTGSFFNSAVGSKSSVSNNNQHPIDGPSDSAPLTGMATTNLAPERKRPVLGRISMGMNTEGPLRKPHIINTKLAPGGSPSVAPVGNPPPTTERLEEMRSLQERLDQEAECELSPSHDSTEGSSFGLEEEE